MGFFDNLISGGVESISVQDAAERMKSSPAPLFIDVREEWEYRSGHARGSKNYPLTQFRKHMAALPKDREILVICQSGNRSVTASKMLLSAGFPSVKNVSGGTITWHRNRLPLE